MLISLLLCFSLAFNITAFAGKLPQDSEKTLSIVRQCGVLWGESIQLKATYGEETTNFVTWSSSDESVIYCSSSGEITGLKAGGYADITCQHLISKETKTMRIYCVEKVSVTKSVYFDTLLVSFYAQPKTGTVAHTYFNLMPILYAFMQMIPYIFPQSFYIGNFQPCTLCGSAGDYVYIRFGEELQYDGFVKGERIIGSLSGMIKLSRSNIIVWGNGVADPEKKLTASNADNVSWTVDDAQVVTFNPKTGQVTGLKPGTTTIRAKADGVEKICHVYSLYKWPLEWTGTLINGTYLLNLNGNEFYQSITLGKDSKFTVYGDMGTSDGYVYGYSEHGAWGFVHISEISTKNTISFYRNLNWGWPLQNKNYNYVYSPHAPRPSLNDEHRGMDINEKTNQADIAGQALIAPFDGVVKWVGADLNTSNGCGYYICITSKTVDPVTGKNLIAIYQHMKSWALFSQNDSVKKGDVVGYAGNTGRSKGSHLHFEVNNWNARIGESGRSDFTYTINPIYFYMDMVKNDELILNMDCSAVNSGYSFYFYNYDK